jgi:hypothetical protein
MPAKPPSAKKRAQPRGRHAGEARRGTLGSIFDELDLSWPVVGFTTLLLLVGFGPLLLAELLRLTPRSEALLVAAGPALVCLGFALLTLRYGLRHAEESGWSRGGIFALAALFVVLGALAGWGLFVSI